MIMTGNPRKKRKPMTEEQRAAASANLAKARAKKKPATYKTIHPKVVALPDDHLLSIINIRKYIKASNLKVAALRRAIGNNEKGAEAKLASKMAYRRACENYLKDGIWALDFLGEDEEKKVQWKCIAPAYDANGIQKRIFGAYYSDIGVANGRH
jgi:hypothetical protein